MSCSTLPRPYSSLSIASAARTCGVIHPAHGLSLGNASLSRSSTSSPPCRSLPAQVEPAGPPPTTRTSQLSITTPRGCGEMGAGQGDEVVGRAREDDLEQLQEANPEIGDAAGKVKPPGADKGLIEHLPDLLAVLFEALQPLFAGSSVVQAQVFHVEDGELPRFEQLHHLAQRRRVAAGEDPLQKPGAHGGRNV